MTLTWLPRLRPLCYTADRVHTGYLSELFVSFQGEGLHAGRRQLFVRLGGCNLRCRYCDTPESLVRVPRFRVHRTNDGPWDGANPVSVTDLLRHAGLLLEAEGPVDGVAVTGGEPLLQAEFLGEVLQGDVLPRPRVLETNGVLPERLAAVLPLVEVVSMDIKLPSNTGEAVFWDVHAEFLRLARPKAYVKVLVDAATAPEEVERAAQLVRAQAPEAPLFLQPISDAHGRVDVNSSVLARFHAVARRHLADVRVVPQIHKMLGIR